MTWTQHYNPLGNLLLSALVAGLPVFVLLGLLALIPCVGFVILFVVNSSATSVLQRNGIAVGLLGARLSDIG